MFTASKTFLDVPVSDCCFKTVLKNGEPIRLGQPG